MRDGGHWLALCSQELLGIATEKGEGGRVAKSLWAAVTKIPQTGGSTRRTSFLTVLTVPEAGSPRSQHRRSSVW